MPATKRKPATKKKSSQLGSSASGRGRGASSFETPKMIQRLVDLSTLKHPKRERSLNLRLYETVDQVKADVPTVTYHDLAMFEWLKRRVAKGEFSDFPEQLQHDGAHNLFNFKFDTD